MGELCRDLGNGVRRFRIDFTLSVKTIEKTDRYFSTLTFVGNVARDFRKITACTL